MRQYINQKQETLQLITQSQIVQSNTNLLEDSQNIQTNEQYIPFIEKYPLYSRKKWANEAFIKFPQKVPLIIEQTNINPAKHSSQFWRAPMVYQLPQIQNPKFLVPNQMIMSDLSSIVKTKLNVTKNENLVFITKNKVLRQNDILYDIYSKYKDNDGFLYINYLKEETYGAV